MIINIDFNIDDIDITNFSRISIRGQKFEIIGRNENRTLIFNVLKNINMFRIAS